MPDGNGPEQAGVASSPVHDHASGHGPDSKKGTTTEQTTSPGAEAPTLLDAGTAEIPAPIEPTAASESPTMVEAPTAMEVPTFAEGALNGSPKAAPKSPSSWGAIVLLPGMLLGERYEILQLLGEGGMGAVYTAKGRGVCRKGALK